MPRKRYGAQMSSSEPVPKSIGSLVPFGIDAGGVLRTAYEVPRGLACECVCPGCGAVLLSRQGQHVVWHFAHAAGSAGASPHCGETAIHKAGKDVLKASAGKILSVPGVPENEIGHARGQFLCRMLRCSTEVSLPIIGRQVDVLADVQFIRRAWPEREIASAVTAELPLIVEIAVTNPKGAAYLASLASARLLAVEITLSPASVYAELEKRGGSVSAALKRLVLGPRNANRRWLNFDPGVIFEMEESCD